MMTDRGWRTNRHALLRYAAFWITAGLVAAAVMVAGLRQADDDPPARRAADPLAEVVASGCVLEDPRGRSADVSRPPVEGPPSRPLADGFYADPQPRQRIIGALRRGVVIVQYERRLPSAQVQLLHDAFASPSPRRVVLPDATGMTFKVAATAWGRVIGCSKLDRRVADALRRFAQRYAGRGPDSG
jgi:hypothetical protein